MLCWRASSFSFFLVVAAICWCCWGIVFPSLSFWEEFIGGVCTVARSVFCGYFFTVKLSDVLADFT